jgi:hypothetical protein
LTSGSDAASLILRDGSTGSDTIFATVKAPTGTSVPVTLGSVDVTAIHATLSGTNAVAYIYYN